jgi:hypothetical protein
MKLQFKNAVSLSLREINGNSSEVFPPQENNESMNNVFCGTRGKENDQAKFFLTEELSLRQWSK